MVIEILTFLAQAQPPVGPNGEPLEPTPQAAPEQFFGRVPMDEIWSFIDGLTWLPAVMAIATGLIYLFYGWRLFRILVAINFSLIGMGVGIFLGDQLGSRLWGGILGTFLMAAVSYPFLKYAVSALGALSGALVGAALWRTFLLPDALVWVGALAGFVAGAFLTFSSFKYSVMLFTALQGATCVVVGCLALLNDYPGLGEHVYAAVYTKPFLLPVLILGPTFVGLYLQLRLYKHRDSFKMPE